ncbi:hypothetical protein NSB25_14825 [Acetatifactor muris]|uniref:Uncharacterized protein n=1 Tax=Acetatifactor muris TaxID=879566 RepID=A0A2K4ZIW3_9FIRM|nr:hypothetical protein [Acetatifactor muris]MCR2048560.1 hypothetical protein [Acetatifactor muris]SOY30391.1 hypothetical protein AMURIS_03118 [Acetatifactor muris]
MSLALEEMRRRAVEKAVEENRIFTLLKSIRNLMEKARQRVRYNLDGLPDIPWMYWMPPRGDRKKLQPLIR